MNTPSSLDLCSKAARNFIESQPGLFINGKWQGSDGDNFLDVVDPSSGITIGKIVDATQSDVDRAVAAAKAAFATGSEWRTCGPDKRQNLMLKLADAIEADIDLLSDLISADLGTKKDVAKGFEVPKAIETFRYFAGFATKIKGETIDLSPDYKTGGEFFSYTTKDPVGVVGAITPWNAPVMVTSWKIAPALAAGCTMVIKPAEDACLATLRVVELARQVGFPDGVLNIVTGRGESAGQALLDNKDVDKFAFTGSCEIGKHIAKAAADRLVRLSLELGGKNPMIIMEDADIEAITPAVAMSTFPNAGQICVSGSRVVAHVSVAERLAESLKGFAESLTVGAAFEEDSIIGPVCSKAQFDRVMGYIEKGAEQGRVVAGGEALDREGYYIKPTVITDLPKDSPLLNEEIFGPVITIETYEDINDVIEETNASEFGLCSFVFGSDHGKIQSAVRNLRTGSVFVNTGPVPPAAIALGGYRQSGIGRDLGSEGLGGYLETKSVITRINPH
ncbi:aldehyde dehydrogenase family protein [Leucothrix sargassi]|nr:aldehyde dehydrogenase family protein [Leucothrix sargassi]